MRIQQTLMDRQIATGRIRVIKTYDASFAREAFESLEQSAIDHLSQALWLEEHYERADIPKPFEGYEDFLWDELFESAREEGQVRSFFVVSRTSLNDESLVYVSGDWQSAEAFSSRLAEAQSPARI